MGVFKSLKTAIATRVDLYERSKAVQGQHGKKPLFPKRGFWTYSSKALDIANRLLHESYHRRAIVADGKPITSADNLLGAMKDSDDPIGVLAKHFNVNLVDISREANISEHHLYGSFAVLYDDSKNPPSLVSGRVNIDHLYETHAALKLVDFSGEEHRFSLAEFKGRIAVDSYDKPSPGINNLRLKIGEVINYVDSEFQNLVKFAQELAGEIKVHHKSPFESEKYYEVLAKDLDYTTALIEKFYGQKRAANLMTKLEDGVGEKFIPLLADPGIASRLDKFLLFTKEAGLDIDAISAFDLRTAFSKQLGAVDLYRGLALTDDQADNIYYQDGMLVRRLADHGDVVKLLVHLLYVNLDHLSLYDDEGGAIQHKISQRFAPEKVTVPYHNDIFLSASKDPDCAASIGWHFFPNRAKSNVRPYLAELRVPVLNTLGHGDFFQIPDADESKFEIKGKKYTVYDSGVEVFIPFVVPCADLEINEITIPPELEFNNSEIPE